MGYCFSKGSPMPGMEDSKVKELELEELAASLEVDRSSVGSDEDLGGGPALTGKKRKDLTRGSADENGSVTKRVLRSDSLKLRADAGTICEVVVEVSKSDILADGSRVSTVHTCNGEEENETVNVTTSDTSDKSARLPEDTVDASCVAATEVAPGNEFGTQGSITELDDKRTEPDEKIVDVTDEDQNKSSAGRSSLIVDESQAKKLDPVPFQDQDVDLSAIANDVKVNMGLSRIKASSLSGYDELDNTVLSVDGVVSHSGDQKIEMHSLIDDIHKRSEVSLAENEGCTVDNHIDLAESIKQEERGSLANERKDISPPDIVFTRRKSISTKSCEGKQLKGEEELRFEKRVTRSATVRQREVSESSCKTTANELMPGSKGRKGNVVAHYTRKVSSTASPKGQHAELVESHTTTKNVKGKAVDQRDSGVTGNDNNVDTVEHDEVNETKISLKSHQPISDVIIGKKASEVAVSVVDQNASVSAITEKNTEHTDSEGVKSENKTPVQKSILSVGAKIVASKKRILESGLDKIAGRLQVATPSMKKTRNTSSDAEIEKPNKSSGEKFVAKNFCSDNKRTLRERQHRTACNLTAQDQSDEEEEADSDASYRRTRRGRRRCTVMRKQEDSSDSEEVIVRKNQQKRKYSKHKQRAGSEMNHSSGPSKKGRLGGSVVTESESSSLSRQAEKGKVKVSDGKGKADGASIVKSSSSIEPITTGNLREEKQKISEQIKAILLDAGWKIDLRPRNGRDYMDSVYIPPSGKGSYWSVTKAYYVFLEGVKSEEEGKRHASTSSGCTLSEDILRRLKRVVVNKRTPKAELQKLRKKHGLSRKFKKSKAKSKEKKNRNTKPRRLSLGNERKKRGGCALRARGSNKDSGSGTDGFVPYEWKRTVFSWLIDLDVLSVNTKLKCMDESHSKVLLEGLVTRDGINCCCCGKVLAVLDFVVHAGGEVKKPYRNMLVDGLEMDLLHCLMNAWNKQSDSERQGFFSISTEGDDPNDDTCGICGDGGNLICCDGCPSTFHMSCLGLEALPSDDWSCANCSCKFCHDADDHSDNDSSLHTCSQCKEKYHQACSREIDSITSFSDQSGNLFCQESCRLLFEELQNLLAVKKDLEPEFSCRVIQRIHEDAPEALLALDERVECNSKIAVALSLMDECFLPIVDQRTGINLIRNVVYSCGSNFVRLDFRGFYIFILERGDEIIAAASVRIHGTKLAEMPFIGTRNMYRRQGMCRRLLEGIEMILSSLNVERLIIPAITELVDTWTSKFGFSPLEVSDKQEVKSINMLVFPGTGLLQKQLLKKALTDKHSQGDDADSSALKTGKQCDVANEDSLHAVASADSSEKADDTCNGDVSALSCHS